MGAFATAWNQFFATFTMLLSGIHSLAQSFSNVTAVMEEASGEYKDEATAKRAKAKLALQADALPVLTITQQ